TQAAEIKVTAAQIKADEPRPAAPGQSAAKRAHVKELLTAAREPERSGPPKSGNSGSLFLLSGPLDLVLGPRVRFLLGALMLTGCLLWLRQNDLLNAETISGRVPTTIGLITPTEDAEAPRPLK